MESMEMSKRVYSFDMGSRIIRLSYQTVLKRMKLQHYG